MNQFPYHSLVRNGIIYPATALAVCHGAQEGQSLETADVFIPDDLFRSTDSARPERGMNLLTGLWDAIAVSQVHEPNAVWWQLTFMTDTAELFQALILPAPENSALWQKRVLLCPQPLELTATYRLVHASVANPMSLQTAAPEPALAAGTRIAINQAENIAVECLRAGDAVLTEKNGLQPITEVVKHTRRAVRAEAPVKISAGVLGNTRPLVVIGNPRIRASQHDEIAQIANHDRLVDAHTLVNTGRATYDLGGYLDVFQLKFDQPQTIYAEGIAVELRPASESIAPARPHFEQVRPAY